MRTHVRRVVTGVCFALVGLFSLAPRSEAGTLAYWRFEDGPGQQPGNLAIHTGTDGWNHYNPDIVDSSGNNNGLALWETGGAAGFAYRTSLPPSSPAGTIPQTGATNTYSVQNTGATPATYTDPTGTFSGLVMPEWTVEASYYPTSGSGFRTFVGRDGLDIVNGNPILSALYLQVDNNDRLAIKFTDEAGFFHEAISSSTISLNTWYNVAATSDGSTLSLYLNTTPGDAYSLIASTDLTLSGSTDTALTNAADGTQGGPDWSPGDWTVGRGLNGLTAGGQHADWALGYIDEVRISDTALSTSQMLFAVPEPGVLVMLPVAGLALVGLRRFRRRLKRNHDAAASLVA